MIKYTERIDCIGMVLTSKYLNIFYIRTTKCYNSQNAPVNLESFVLSSSIVIVVVVVWLKNLLSEFFFAFVDISIELVSVFTNRELLVVINRNIDFLGTRRFIFGIVELWHIRMSECLFSGESLVGVEVEQALEEVECVVGSGGKHIAQTLGLGGR